MSKFSESELEKIEKRKDHNDIHHLVKELKNVYGFSYQSRFNRASQLLELLLVETSSYHNHKETMAHSGMALELAIFVGIVFLKHWPPIWVPETWISAQLLAFLGFTLIWLLIHVFIRWQLRNRRDAALRYAALLRTIRKWTLEPPEKDDLSAFKNVQKSRFSFKVIIDFIIPWPSAPLYEDVSNEDYPCGFITELDKQKKKGTGAIHSEIFLAIGNFLIFIFVFLRTFLDP